MKKLVAIVASHNEAAMLDDCLRSLEFCNEILVYNLRSDDNTTEIAHKHKNVTLQLHDRPELIEMLHREIVPKVHASFVLILDPDERIDPKLAQSIKQFIKEAPKDVGIAYAPTQYYFKHRPLVGTVWGGHNKRRLLLKPKGVEIRAKMSQAYTPKEGYKVAHLNRQAGAIHHYWSDSYVQLIKKHMRYLEHEGATRHRAGQRYSLVTLLLTAPRAFWHCYVSKNGYKDGINGLGLSLVYAWYETCAFGKLKQYNGRE